MKREGRKNMFTPPPSSPHRGGSASMPRAKKSLGQNFLTSRAALNKIAAAGEVGPGDIVLEIGPGKGALTEILLDAGAHVIAVEKDRRMIPLLEERFAEAVEDGHLTLINDDILDPILLRTLADTHELVDGSFKLIANIPYYITGAIFERFLEHGPRPTKMVLLVQKEVAERVVARNKKESILSLSVKAFGTPRIIAKVPRGAFTPAPKVDSAILAITGISDAQFRESGGAPADFFALVRAGFHAKRKTLLNNLAEHIKRPKEALAEELAMLGIDPKVRPEDIAINGWFTLLKRSRT